MINWIKSNKLQQQLLRDKLVTELKYLKAQINPHFLFNTLNTAYSSAIKNNDDATADSRFINTQFSSAIGVVFSVGNVL